jgi:hypothetical protein
MRGQINGIKFADLVIIDDDYSSFCVVELVKAYFPARPNMELICPGAPEAWGTKPEGYLKSLLLVARR